MPVIFTEWHNRNENRAYPLHDRAGKTDVNGKRLTDDLLVDAHLLIPKAAGLFVYLSSISVTDRLVSATFMATDMDPYAEDPPIAFTPAFVPIAVVTVDKPVEKYRNIAVEPMLEGVGGWVAFGNGADEQSKLALRFDDPSQTLLNPRSARFYDELPVSSIGRAGVADVLRDLVEMRGQPGVITAREVSRVVNNKVVRGLAIGLDTSVNPREVLERFAGPCFRRPDSRNCEGFPFVDINTVKPDADGNVNVRFEGDPRIELTRVPDGSGCGFVLDLPLGLSQVCDPLPSSPAFEPSDKCEDVDFPVGSPFPGPLPSPVPPSASSPSSPSSPGFSPSPGPEGFCEDFSSTVTDLEVVNGVFTRQIQPVFGEDLRTHRLVSAPGFGEKLVLHPAIPLDGDVGYTLEVVVRPRTNDGNAFLVYGFKNTNNFRFAGITLKAFPGPDIVPGAVYRGRRLAVGDFVYPSGLGGPYFFDSLQSPVFNLSSTDVKITLTVVPTIPTERVVTIIFEWIDFSETPRSRTLIFAETVDSLDDPFDGLVGFGCLNGISAFDNFGIDCMEPFGDEFE